MFSNGKNVLNSFQEFNSFNNYSFSPIPFGINTLNYFNVEQYLPYEQFNALFSTQNIIYNLKENILNNQKVNNITEIPHTENKCKKVRKTRSNLNRKWTPEEDEHLREVIQHSGAKNWKKVARLVGNGRTDVQCLHRWRKVISPDLIKGPWTKDEDELILKLVGDETNLHNIKWSNIASHLQGRIGKQCRERYLNYLQKNLRKDSWTEREDMILFEIQRIIGNKWSELSKVLPGRSENSIKNRFNSKNKVHYYNNHPNPLLPEELKIKHQEEIKNGLIVKTTSVKLLPFLLPFLPQDHTNESVNN